MTNPEIKPQQILPDSSQPQAFTPDTMSIETLDLDLLSKPNSKPIECVPLAKNTSPRARTEDFELIG